MIKKHGNKNEYYLAGSGLWVRNFTKKNVNAFDINSLITREDMQVMLNNESENHQKTLQRIDTESFIHRKVAIIGDGLGFEQNQHILDNLADDVTIIGVNETMKLWKNTRHMHYYVVNDPYESCLNFVPKQQRMWPKCIASTRTHPDFISRFDGLVYSYSPTPDGKYSGFNNKEADYFIDDYRNAVCAAVGLAYRFGVQKLMLFWCADAYDNQRPGSEKLTNGSWIYPQQKLAHQLVDSNLYWLKQQGVKIGHHSRGPEYKHAAYIAGDYVTRFFAE